VTYSDWQMHYENCPECTAEQPCKQGEKLRKQRFQIQGPPWPDREVKR
jgi:transposase-like protein